MLRLRSFLWKPRRNNGIKEKRPKWIKPYHPLSASMGQDACFERAEGKEGATDKAE
jgi:hypothetical protein